jgi:general nucleoside transport system permease protein
VSEFFTTAILTATVASGVQLAAPFLLASLGETIGQRSGVLNLGVDGIMLLGAFTSYYVALETGNLLLAVLAGMAVGVACGLATAFISVTLRAEQGISGIGVYLFALGLTSLLFLKLVGTPLPIDQPGKVEIPFLHDLPFLGETLFQQDLLVYIAFVLVPVVAFVLNRTTFGLNIRAVGENPAAADSVGVGVARTRYATVTIGSTLAGLAGAALLIDVGIFQQNITNAQGFIAVALVYFGGWRPVGVMLGSLLYGMTQALILSWKGLGIIPVSLSDLAAAAPAVITVVALLTVARRFRQPAALATPYIRGG